MRRTRRSLRKKARSLRRGARFSCVRVYAGGGVCGCKRGGECADVCEGRGCAGVCEGGVCGCMRGEGVCAGRVVCIEADGRAGECVRRTCVKNIRGEGARGTEGENMRGEQRRSGCAETKKARSGAPSHRGGGSLRLSSGAGRAEGIRRAGAGSCSAGVPQGTSPCRRLTFVDDRPGGERFGGGRRAAMPQHVFLAGDPVDGEEFGGRDRSVG